MVMPVSMRSIPRVPQWCHLPQRVLNVHLVSRFETQPYYRRRSAHAKRFHGAAMRARSRSATQSALFPS